MQNIKMDFPFNGNNLTIETGKLANLASGSVVFKYNGVTMMTTVMCNPEVREGQSFFPLSCEYRESFYSFGKIGGNRYQRREGRLTTIEVLNSRIIDRPLRPMFPKGVFNEIMVTCHVLEINKELMPVGPMGITAASLAALLGGLPLEAPVSGVRVGYVDGQFVLDPSHDQVENGLLDLVVAGTMDSVTMVESGAKQLSPEIMLKAIQFGHKAIKELCQFQLDFVAKGNPTPVELPLRLMAEEKTALVASKVDASKFEALYGLDKVGFKMKKAELVADVAAQLSANIENDEITEGEVEEVLSKHIKNTMRENILNHERRLDNRGLKEVRSLSSEVGVLDTTHGSGLFQRGTTQIMTVLTLGGPGDKLLVEYYGENIEERYIHHYNFPSFAVGECRPNRGPSRRDIGHGFLAQRALLPVLPTELQFPYTMRLVSETLTCDGSSSMGSVCGSSLALMDGGVNISSHVSGIAMGLVMDEETGNYKILSDIQAQEDFLGDMDFKITASEEGITALQMDIKVKGLKPTLLDEVMDQAFLALNEVRSVMQNAIPVPREDLSEYAPQIHSVKIDPAYIRFVIGPGGEMINKITAECNVEININDDGQIDVTAQGSEGSKKAIKWIKEIAYVPAVGDVLDGEVSRIMDFGAFVKFGRAEGLVHISKLSKERVNKVTDICKVGDKMKVEIMEIDSQGRVNLRRVQS